MAANGEPLTFDDIAHIGLEDPPLSISDTISSQVAELPLQFETMSPNSSTGSSTENDLDHVSEPSVQFECKDEGMEKMLTCASTKSQTVMLPNSKTGDFLSVQDIRSVPIASENIQRTPLTDDSVPEPCKSNADVTMEAAKSILQHAAITGNSSVDVMLKQGFLLHMEAASRTSISAHSSAALSTDGDTRGKIIPIINDNRS
mmetsp:Transcript_72165/g.145185  ORF Transcript_72165/g.145185 Transcript_72165/m.145185 type:complete len:202 (+) Transcript_72165:14-619(+)